jgi:hypothetical protein
VIEKMANSSPGLKLHLKLRVGASVAEREAVVRLAHEAGASAVRPLFPEATDGELASLQTIDVDSEAAIPNLLKSLGKHKAVEFVESEVKRKMKLR